MPLCLVLCLFRDRSFGVQSPNCSFRLIATQFTMLTALVYIIMASVMTTLVSADDDINEGDLQFSIPRINARPGKGEYLQVFAPACVQVALCFPVN